MADVTMSREAADTELDRIAADLGIELDEDSRVTVRRALMAGRLSWDAAEETFMVSLIKPIRLDNGETIDTLTVTEPTAGQLQKAGKIHDDMEQSLKMIAYCTDQPDGYIQRIRMRDLNVLGALVGFFR